ncbi:MAG TPA: DUF4249 domain-containing protein [Puia sp.]
MRSQLKILSTLFFLLILLGQCKQTYVSPYKSPATGYLVVEGFIAKGPTRFTLSRVISLPGDSSLPMVTGATVQVEGNDNSTFPLAENGSGVYSADTLPLIPTAQYRLRIQMGGQTYLSDFTAYRPSPAIDSINWIQQSDGVHIFANTHDPANGTRYYQWQFDEVWQYHSAEFSYFKYQPAGPGFPRDTAVQRADSEFVYNCWSNAVSTPLLLGTSTKLAQDVIYRQPLQIIYDGTQRLDELYSILVRQYALTEDAYNYLSLMKSNTESLGSIFDAQPSTLKGNIHCVTNPGEPVVGYVSTGSIQQQRIFINRSQLSSWGYSINCDKGDIFVPVGKEDSFFKFGSYTPLYDEHRGGKLAGWYANQNTCIDCRTQGGNTNKPSFWPN